MRRSVEKPTVGLVDPPRRVGGTYGALFLAEVVGGQGQVPWARSCSWPISDRSPGS